MVSAGDVGGKAGEDVCRVPSVEEILSHETFTVQVGYRSVMTADTGYFGDNYLLNLELPSGERVAACINDDARQRNYEEDYYIMPVGKVVETDLSKGAEFMSRIERFEALSRTDFYLDMNGNGRAGLVSAALPIEISAVWENPILFFSNMAGSLTKSLYIVSSPTVIVGSVIAFFK